MKLPQGYVAGVGAHKPKGGFGGFGQKMLEKMGWEKGQGLGKDKHGMKDAIDVKKKEDTLGVGATESNWKWNWKYWEDAYNSAAQTISHPNSGSSSSGSDSDNSSSGGSDSDSSDSSDDDEPALAAIVAASMHRDGTACTASKAELRLAKELAKDRRDIKGREGKLARIRQQEEAEAAAARARLGLEPSTSSGGEKRKTSSSATANQSDAEGSKAAKRRKTNGAAAAAAGSKAATGKAEKQRGSGEEHGAGEPSSSGRDSAAAAGGGGGKLRKVIIVACKEDQVKRVPFVATPREGWWGAKMFVSAGLLEGIEEAKEHVQRQRQEFTEATQENLYMRTHDAQRQGRRGLGKSQTLKIAGGKWEGKKTTFEEGDAEEKDEQNEEEPQAGVEKQQPEGERQRKGKKGKRRREEEHAEEPEQQRASSSCKEVEAKQVPGGSAAADEKVKWAKLAVKHLKGVPGGALKWKKLWSAVWEQVQQQEGGAGCSSRDAGACKLECLRKLEKSKKLMVKGKVVGLA